MFLLASVIVGLTAGLLRAWITRRPLQSYDTRLSWLLLIAFLPQLIAFVLPTKTAFPDALAPAALVASQIGLLLFAILNLKIPGFGLMAAGLALNLVVTIINGGLMPISPETATTIFPDAPAGAMVLGERLGTGKDILLTVQETRLWFLSDRFLIPYGQGYYVAFSLGDLAVTGGIIWALWGIGAPPKPNLTTSGKLSLTDN
jgi:uncharacterized protein with PQ loop repeat